MHKAGKGYKSILDGHQSTVRQIVYKLKHFSSVATLTKSGCPVKMTARAQCIMFREGKKNPIQSIEVNQQQHGFNKRKYAFWSGPVRVLTSTR